MSASSGVQQLCILLLGGESVEVQAASSETVASLKRSVAAQLAIDETIQIDFICGGEVLLDTAKVGDLPDKTITLARSFGASLCEVQVHGEFPAEPQDFFDDSQALNWPRTPACREEQKDDLRKLLDRKTPVEISATRANLTGSGLQPDPGLPISQVMLHVRHLEKLRLQKGSKFTGFMDPGDMFEIPLDSEHIKAYRDRLVMLGVLGADELDRGLEEANDAFSWRVNGLAMISSFEYMLALFLLEAVHAGEVPKKYNGKELWLKKAASGPFALRKFETSPGNFSEEPFVEFQAAFGDRASEAWEAAGTKHGISTEEQQAIADSEAAVAEIEARLRAAAWEAYVLRFDFQLVKGADIQATEEALDVLLRYMACGMAFSGGSYTFAHHTRIERSSPHELQITLTGLAHPIASRQYKGILGRSMEWFKKRVAKLDSGWQMIWQFASHLRELGIGRPKANRIQLRWRTICKLIKSRTLRRCGVPASSNSSSLGLDSISDSLKFLFFEGTEALESAKRALLYNMRCRRVGFSRLPAREPGEALAKPHACDIHFLSDAGVPLAWMWGLNVMEGSCWTDVIRSSADETSTRELRSDVQASNLPGAPKWTEMPTTEVSKAHWPKLGWVEERLQEGGEDSDSDVIHRRDSDSDQSSD